MATNEFYSGETAIADYLRPLPERMIPLVELPASLNPYLKTHNIRIAAKLMNTLPLGNVKSLPAWSMLENAAKTIKGKHVIEASSGNTVFSLGILAQYFGVKAVTAIASPEVGAGKLAALQLAGVHVRLEKGPICPVPGDPKSAIEIARREGQRVGYVNAGQYDNAANPAVHERITGPQIYAQLGERLGMYVAGLGTTGSLLGAARYLKRVLPDLRIGGVVRAENNPVPGVRTANGLRQVAFDWRTVLTESLQVVSEKQSYEQSLKLIRAGLLVGPSSGFAYAGCLQYLGDMAKVGTLHELANKYVVFLCPDSPFPYVDDYTRVLDDSFFPTIQNAHLRGRDTQPATGAVPTMQPEDVMAALAPFALVDVREPDEFDDHHIYQAVNIPLAAVEAWIEKRPVESGVPVVFICKSGRRSAEATRLARQAGKTAYSLQGGMTEWSAKNLPREVPAACTIDR